MTPLKRYPSQSFDVAGRGSLSSPGRAAASASKRRKAARRFARDISTTKAANFAAPMRGGIRL